MLSRRAFLSGGLTATAAVAAAAAGLGAIDVLSEDDRRKPGQNERPDRDAPPPDGEIVSGRLRSSHMGGPVAWAMARPRRAPAEAALVCLHGRNANHRFAFDTVHLHDVMAEARLPLAVAAVDGGLHSYWHARRDGTDAGAMLVDEFVPLVRATLDVERIAVVGWSMGGFGALLAAERHPGLFDAVVASSPALFLRAEDSTPGAFDGRADFEANDVFAGIDRLDPARVRIDCGRGDPFYPAGKAFAERLGPDATTAFPDGLHDHAYWRGAAPGQVGFAARSMDALPDSA